MAAALKRVITPTDGEAAQSYVMENNHRALIAQARPERVCVCVCVRNGRRQLFKFN